MKSLTKSYLIKAPVSKVWQALVNPKIINQWGGGEAKMDGEEGTDFELWNGDIHGENLEVINEKKLVQDWTSGDWEKPSKVTFNLRSEGDSTKLDLDHTNIPDSEATEIDKGWDEYYLGPIKDLLEN